MARCACRGPGRQGHEEHKSHCSSARNSRPKCGARTYLRDRAGGQSLRPGHPSPVWVEQEGPSGSQPVSLPPLFPQDTQCSPQALSLYATQLLTSPQAWGEHVGGLTHLPEVDPGRRPTQIGALWTGNSGMQSVVCKGAAVQVLVPWGEAQLEEWQWGREGPYYLGIGAGLTRLWWKHNLKPEKDRVNPRRQHGVWVEAMNFGAEPPGWNPHSTTSWLCSYGQFV